MQLKICLENTHRAMHFSQKQMLLKSSMVVSQLAHLSLFFGYTTVFLNGKKKKTTDEH